MHKQFKYHLTPVLKNFHCRLSTWKSTTMSFKFTSIANLSDSDNELYKTELARRHAEAETLLQQQEEKKRLECQAQKEAKIVEWKWLKEEVWRKKEKAEWQRKLAYHLEADHIAAVKKQCYKNWTKTFLSPTTPPSDEEMNLINLPPLTKRQHVQYLPPEIPEACQQYKELTREMGASVVGGESPCERCADFGILCIPQNLP